MPEPDVPPPDRSEPEDAGCEAIPYDLVELHQVLAWEAAVAEAKGKQIPRGGDPS